MDLFTGPHTSRNAPETSAAASEKIAPKLPSIRKQVLRFAVDAGSADETSGGFIDEDLLRISPDQQTFDRSYRPRRTELTDENHILDSGFRRKNRGGNECVVWIHRMFASNAPSLAEREKREKKADSLRRAEIALATVERWARQMHSEGRGAAHELTDAAQEIRQALKHLQPKETPNAAQ